MNFIKKFMVLSFAVVLVSTKVECRDMTKEDGLCLGDYLTQLASIYLIDSNDTNHVSIAAAGRSVFNAVSIILSFDRLLGVGALTKEDLLSGVSAYFRSKNVFKDLDILNNASKFASNNAGRKGDKNLTKKKLCHYAWLTVNKLLPYLKEYRGWTNNFVGATMSEISELYRQKLMYELIQNKKAKSA